MEREREREREREGERETKTGRETEIEVSYHMEQLSNYCGRSFNDIFIPFCISWLFSTLTWILAEHEFLKYVLSS